MDSPRAIGSSLPMWQARSLAGHNAESASFASLVLPPEPNSTATLDFGHGSDPATEQQRMLHFISHVDAECFISLLQTMDPMPDDYRARAEYKRFYRQLHETLEVPLPAQDLPR
jgi:hypothetical protein